MSRHDFRNEHDHVKNLSDPPDSAEAIMVGEYVWSGCFSGTLYRHKWVGSDSICESAPRLCPIEIYKPVS